MGTTLMRDTSGMGDRAHWFQLRWEDSWRDPDDPTSSGASRNLNLRLYRTVGDNMSRAKESVNVQNGEHMDVPLEYLRFDRDSDMDDPDDVIDPEDDPGTYCFGVQRVVDPNPDVPWVSPRWVQVQAYSARTNYPKSPEATGSGSIVNPAESANPGMLAVGGADESDSSVIKKYSSRGPTPDGRTKPDLVGVIPAGRSGTSFSSPRVAGLAALVIQELGDIYTTPAQVAQYLRDSAEQPTTDLSDLNNTWGRGLAQLPSAPPQPGGLAAIREGDDVLVSWATVPGTTVKGYRLEYRREEIGGSEGWSEYELATRIQATVSDPTSFTHEVDAEELPFDEGYRYQYRVRARPAGHWSDPFPAGGFVLPPSSPRSLTVAAGNRKATLAWEAPASLGAADAMAGYDYRKSEDGGKNWGSWTDTQPNRAETTPLMTTVALEEDLTSCTEYTFQVRARIEVDGTAVAGLASEMVTGRPVWSGQLLASGTWSGTECVAGDLTVPGEMALRIEANTEVEFSTRVGDADSRSELIVDGALLAEAGVIFRSEEGASPPPSHGLRVGAEGSATLEGLILASGEHRLDAAEEAALAVVGDLRVKGGTTPGILKIEPGSELRIGSSNRSTTEGPPSSPIRLVVEAGASLDAEDVTLKPTKAAADAPGWHGIVNAGTVDLSDARLEDGKACVSGSGTLTLDGTVFTNCGMFSGPRSKEFPEHSTEAVGSYGPAASGPFSGSASIRWSLSNTDDFSLAASGGDLTLDSAPLDYEKLTESERELEVTVQAEIGPGAAPTATATQAVSVTITNVREDGTITLDPLPPRVGTEITATLEDPDKVTRVTRWYWNRAGGEAGSASDPPVSATKKYTPPVPSVGHRLQVVAQYDDEQGTGQTAESAITAPILAREPSGAPASLTAAPGDGEVALSWEAPEEGGATVTEYRYRYRTGAGPWTSGTSTGTSVTVDDLTNGSEYTFEVRAFNSALSEPATVKMTPGLPKPPVLTASVSGTTVTLRVQLTEDHGDDITQDHTRIYYFDDGVKTWHSGSATSWLSLALPISSVSPYASFFSFGYTSALLLPTNREYTIEVQVSNSRGRSASASVRVRVGNPLPSTLTIEGPSEASYYHDHTKPVATYVARDSRGPASDVTWTITGDDRSHFNIPSGSLEFKSTNRPSYDNPGDSDADRIYDIELSASASGRTGGPHPVAITIIKDSPGVVSFTDPPRVNQEIEASLTDEDNATDRQWSWEQVASSTGTVSPISQTGSRYTPVPADEGSSIRATVTYDDDHGSDKTARKVSQAVLPRTPTTRPGVVTFTGADPPWVDLDVTALLTDPDNARDTTWVWQRVPSTGVPTTLADTDKTYRPVAADAGHTLQATATYTDDTGANQTATAATGLVKVNTAGRITLTNADPPRVRGQMTATLVDPDMSQEDAQDIVWTWDRVSATPEDSAPKSINQGPTYTPGTNDQGRRIRVAALYDDAFGDNQRANRTTPVVEPPLGNQPPRLRQISKSNVAENTETKVGVYEGSDPENGALTWSRAGTDSSSFRFETVADQPNQRELHFKTSPNYEAKRIYSVTVRVTDPADNTASYPVLARVTNVPEAGTVTLDPAAPQACAWTTGTLQDVDGGIETVGSVGSPPDQFTYGWTWIPASAASSGGRSATTSTTQSYMPPSPAAGRSVSVTVRYGDNASDRNTVVKTSGLVRANKPALPHAFKATGGRGQASLDWEAPDNCGSAITQYRYRYRRGNGSWSSRTTRSTSVTLSDLAAGDYRFEVKAVNGAGESPTASGTATVLAVPPPNRPPVFDDYSATVSEGTDRTVGTYTASDPDAGDAISSWTLDSASQSSFTLTPSDDMWSAALAFSGDPDHETEDSYTVVITVADRAGATDTGTIRIAVEDEDEPPTMTISSSAPKVGEGFTLTVSDEDGVSNTRWAWYTVDAAAARDATGRLQQRSTNTSLSATFVANTAAVNKRIKGTVDYTDAHDPDQYASVTSLWTVKPNVPTVPRNVRAVRGDEQVSLRWSAPSDNRGADILKYYYNHRLDGGRWSGSDSTTSHSATITRLTNGSLYHFRVRARNPVGFSDYGSDSEIPAGKPDAPSGFRHVRGSQTSVQVLWNEPESNGSGITEYLWSWKSGIFWDSESSVTATNFVHSSSPAGQANEYRVRARNGAGLGPYGNYTVPREDLKSARFKPVAEFADSTGFGIIWAPNPFNSRTTIFLALTENAPVTLTVHNITGQTVARLREDDFMEAGLHSLEWSGRDDQGRPVGSGLYLYRLLAGGEIRVGKLALIRCRNPIPNPPLNARGRIRRADSDGSRIQDVFAPLVREPSGLVLHGTAGRLLWTDLLTTGTVLQAHLDTLGPRVLVSGLDCRKTSCWRKTGCIGPIHVAEGCRAPIWTAPTLRTSW